MKCGDLQLWGPIYPDIHIEMHKHAPWGAGESVMEEKGLGGMEKGGKENVCQRKKGRRVSANCLFSIPRCHTHHSWDILQILTGKIRTL